MRIAWIVVFGSVPAVVGIHVLCVTFHEYMRLLVLRLH
jgi:hypothetical protein